MDAPMILPPKELRETIDKVAPFVASRGKPFEDRLKEDGKKDFKLSFINVGDPFYPYYAKRVEDYRSGKLTSVARGGPDAILKHDNTASAAQASAASTPREHRFSQALPPISAIDLAILRLTARSVAVNGRSFITTLLQREGRNPQFDFLRGSHPLFGFFMQVVQQYALVLDPPPSLLAAIRADDADDYGAILRRCGVRAEAEVGRRRERKQEALDAAEQRRMYAQIDWSAFVVVETIEFAPSDEAAELPGALDLERLKRASLEQKRLMMELDEPTRAFDRASLYIEHPDTQPVSAKLPAPTPSPATGSRLPQTRQQRQTCPRCGELIPVDELEEHMRVELLDPRYADQKARYAAKHHSRPSNTLLDDPADGGAGAATSNDVAANLRNILNRKRADNPNTDKHQQPAGKKPKVAEIGPALRPPPR
ncbi:SF3a splicing factor complex subunit [Savitreella phatthalungensis]